MPSEPAASSRPDRRVLRERPDLDAQRFAETGFSLAVLAPGRPNGLYHAESAQEDFFVVAGECLLIVEGEERPLRAWDSCTVRRTRRTSSWARGTGRASCS